MTRRSIVLIGALVAMLTLALAAPVSAAPKIHFQLIENKCTDQQLALRTKVIKDQGVTGIVKVTIDSQIQKRVGSKWKLYHQFDQISRTLDGGKEKYTLDWRFYVTSPYSYKYRIVTVMKAWNNTPVWTATQTSVTCGPTA